MDVIIDFDCIEVVEEDDGRFTVRNNYNNVASYGDTKISALENYMEALEGYYLSKLDD